MSKDNLIKTKKGRLTYKPGFRYKTQITDHLSPGGEKVPNVGPSLVDLVEGVKITSF